ncbi:NAD(P)H-binding protein [Nocardioides sp.]|uniref:NAD(P)H-binding protein n=1 Tax=Nocardioides sp. TaxID=35761 RepID=UPI00286B4779|nr:NAD(P)H-binding protein [Nocardioides sp.]
MSHRVAVTGSTGALGGLVARQLTDLAPLLVVRDPSRAPDLGGEVRACSYDDAPAARAALAGVDVLFMVSASESEVRRGQHRTFIQAAADAGVGHVVYTSFAGASPDAVFTLGRDHHDAEAAIRSSGMAFTLLRDNFYLDVLPLFTDETGVIRGPAGSGRVAAVARADVADVAAAVLRDPGAHAGTTYTLCGPEALTLAETAARISAAQGREVRFEDETVEAAYAWRREQYGAALWQLDAWVSTYTAIADGSLAALSDDVRRVAGREPRSLEDVLAGR